MSQRSLYKSPFAVTWLNNEIISIKITPSSTSYLPISPTRKKVHFSYTETQTL